MSAQEGRSARPTHTFIIHHDYLTEQDSPALQPGSECVQWAASCFNFYIFTRSQSGSSPPALTLSSRETTQMFWFHLLEQPSRKSSSCFAGLDAKTRKSPFAFKIYSLCEADHWSNPHRFILNSIGRVSSEVCKAESVCMTGLNQRNKAACLEHYSVYITISTECSMKGLIIRKMCWILRREILLKFSSLLLVVVFLCSRFIIVVQSTCFISNI